MEEGDRRGARARGEDFRQLWQYGAGVAFVFSAGERAAGWRRRRLRSTGRCTCRGWGWWPTRRRGAGDSEIAGVVADFAKGAKNAILAGFDGVEIHGANGYLVDQFIRDKTNQRTDRYGGSVGNRGAVRIEVTTAVADAVGAEHVGIRLSPSNTFNDMSDSLPRETFGHVVKELDKFGLAYLHLIAPLPKDAKHGGADHDLIPVSFFRPLFKGVLIANGGYTYEAASDAVAEGWADAVAFGTAFLANPDLVERFRRGAELNRPDPSTFYGGNEKGYIDYPELEAVAV